jgi:hypothetical protein
MNYSRTVVVLWLSLMPSAPLFAAEMYIVENGKPRAEIVIAERPERSVHIAAADLQEYVQKISGARLPIVTEPSISGPSGKTVKLFVGRSPFTEQLGITSDALKFGAYRLVSDDDWMVFLGDDTNFTPIEPYAKSRREMDDGRYLAAFDKITGDTLGDPYKRLFMHEYSLPGDLGVPDSDRESAAKTTRRHWDFDERGSLNAVCGFLTGLGVRWYLPGELGEIVPEMKTLPLPKIDEIVQPDLEMRRLAVSFSATTPATARWLMRLGVRDPGNELSAHGLSYMMMRDELYEKHPEWFIQLGGKRLYKSGSTKNKLCLSQPDFFETTVRYVRTLYDHYNYHVVSLTPPDGYTSICQCPLCQGKDQPERGSRGSLSNHVFEFANRVAKEVGKTHPDRRVVCLAYGANSLPPTNIDKLEPNLQVTIVGGRRPKSGVAAQPEIRALRESWYSKTDRPIAIWENYPFTNSNWYLPAFMARTIGTSISETKGYSRGEEVWLSLGAGFESKALGFNHVQVYFTARSYWGGPQQDVGAMLEEYCRLFYGPASNAMREFFDYCEVHWTEMETDKAPADRALALFDVAKAKVDPSSIYGRRLALIDEFLNGLRNKSIQLAQKRGVVPKLRFNGDARGIVVDGKLDDEYWQSIPAFAAGRLREIQTGRSPALGTTVKAGWLGENLYFAIRCDERPGEKPVIATTKHDDMALWYGDVVEILLATDAHSYYQLAINPAGALVDLDRGVGKDSWATWESQAEIATHVADDHWTVEVRIPTTTDDVDPLHLVVGRKPTVSLPWYVNVCRQRERENGEERSALSPTGGERWHDPMKFAHFYHGNHHEFEADPSARDFLSGLRAATQLVDERKNAEAIAAFIALADDAERKPTELQQSFALKQAAATARRTSDYEQADALAARIPIEAERKNAEMQTLLARRKYAELVERFGDEDLTKRPFWAAGEAYYVRGRAYAAVGNNSRARSDLQSALELTSERQTREQIEAALAKLPPI